MHAVSGTLSETGDAGRFRRGSVFFGQCGSGLRADHHQLIAYTPWGGYFKPGRTGQRNGRPGYWDTIYLCPGFNTLVDDEMRAFVIVHELAHFVGYPQKVDDVAYNWEGDGGKIRGLQPSSRTLNAESYANFADQAGTASDVSLSR
jgi:hypothetical protein